MSERPALQLDALFVRCSIKRGKPCVSRQLGLARSKLAARTLRTRAAPPECLELLPVPARAIPECQAARYQRADDLHFAQSGPADTLSLPNAPHLPQAPWQLQVSVKLHATSLPLPEIFFNRNPGATWPTVECAQCFDAIRCLFILGKDF